MFARCGGDSIHMRTISRGVATDCGRPGEVLAERVSVCAPRRSRSARCGRRSSGRRCGCGRSTRVLKSCPAALPGPKATSAACAFVLSGCVQSALGALAGLTRQRVARCMPHPDHGRRASSVRASASFGTASSSPQLPEDAATKKRRGISSGKHQMLRAGSSPLVNRPNRHYPEETCPYSTNPGRSAASRWRTASCWPRWPGSATGSCACRPSAYGAGSDRLGDGLEPRPRLWRQAHAQRVSAAPPGRRPDQRPALWRRPGDHARGRGDRRRRRR